MGRKKIEMKRIEDRQKRNVSFTKRRHGLFKKAKDLCCKTGADISILVFSPGGNPFTFSSSSSLNDLFNYNVNVKEEVEVAGGDGFWWDKLNFEELSIDKLMAVKNQLLDVKEKVAKKKKQELLAIATATPTTTVEDSSMEYDLRKLLAEAYDDADNWLPSFDDLFKGLDDIEKLPTLNDLEIDMVF